MRVIYAWIEKKQFLKSDQKDQVLYIERHLFTVLAFIGIHATLGWNTKEVDERLSNQLEHVKPGEYKRASELIERSVYGDIELKPHEMRTLQVFLKKVRDSVRDGKNRKVKIMLRYEWIYRKPEKNR